MTLVIDLDSRVGICCGGLVVGKDKLKSALCILRLSR
jgi:hypothetical protein